MLKLLKVYQLIIAIDKVFRLHRMREMQTILTDVHGICLSVCSSVCLSVTQLKLVVGVCSVRHVPYVQGHSV